MKKVLNSYLQPAFILCVAVLAAGILGRFFIENYFRVWFEKEPIPLKKSLDFLDEQKLGPFKVLNKRKIENKEIVESLGTEYYIQWDLLDTEAAEDSTAKGCMLFITYYEKPDAVPHVPEECYAGGGFQKVKAGSGPVTFNVTFAKDLTESVTSADSVEIPGQCVVFGRDSTNIWQPNIQFPVLYFFNSNGSYVNTRTDARIALAKNIRSRYSYFSKVEIVFSPAIQSPSHQDAVKTSEKLLGFILPLLEKEHWPDITAGPDKKEQPEQTNKT